MNPRLFFILVLVVIVCCIGIGSILVPYVSGSSSRPPAGNASSWVIIRPPSDVQALVLDGSGQAWIGGKDGISLMNLTTNTLLTTPGCLLGIRYVKDLLIDPDNALWIGTDSGLYRYQNGTCAYYSTGNGLPDNTVFCLMSDTSGRVHAGTMKGAVTFERGEITGYELGMQNPIVFTMAEDFQGGLWFGSYASQGGGVSILTNGSWQFFGLEDGLPHKAITSMLSARDGSFWVGMGVYNRGGAVRFTWNGTAWNIAEVFSKESGLAGEKVRSLYQDDTGTIWIGSESDGIARYVNGSFQVYSVQDGLSDNEVIDFVQDDKGDLFLGTKNGITKMPAMHIPGRINPQNSTPHNPQIGY